MDVQRFHLKLLGVNQGRTPEEFWLHDAYKALYSAHDNGLHGYSTAQLYESLFTATLVLALALTESIHPVYFAVPKKHVKWVVEQVERVGRYIFRCRKGDKEGVVVLRQAFQQIRVTHKILELGEEPERWVMLGFTNEDVLPPWAKSRLLPLGELRVPLTGARTATA